MKKYAYSIFYSDGDFKVRTTLNSPGETKFNITMDCLNLGIRLIEKVIPNRDWKVDKHQHSCFELHIIPCGKGYINIEGIDFEVKGGQFYLTGPGVNHSQLSDKTNPMTEYCFAFEIADVNADIYNTISDKYAIKELKEELSILYPCAFSDIYETRIKFEEIFKEVEQKSPGYKFHIKTLITDIVISVLRTVVFERGLTKRIDVSQKAVQSERINKISKFVSSNYMKDINVNDITSILFLSPKQINRVLKKEFNQTFHDYLLYYRFLLAKSYVVETNSTIEDIAHKCGFSNLNHLYQVFKRFNCPSPLKLRKLGS